MAQVGLIIRRFQKGRSRPIEIADEPLTACSNDYSNEALFTSQMVKGDSRSQKEFGGRYDNVALPSTSSNQFSKLDKFVPQIKLEIEDSNYNGSSTSNSKDWPESALRK